MLSSFALRPVTATADDFGTLIFNHQIAIGMTFGNVQAAWGKPEKVDRSNYNGRIVEYWFYNNSNWMVVFENGRVRSFHQ
jgi:hypothetical protein